MLHNAFSPLPSSPPTSQPDQPPNPPLSSSESQTSAHDPARPPPPPPPPQPPLLLSRCATDLLDSGISASVLLGAAYESLHMIHVAITTASTQRRELMHGAGKEVGGKQGRARAPSFSRPRRRVGAVEGDEDVERELAGRLERLEKGERGVRGDIAWLKRYIETETLGGGHQRTFSYESWEREGVVDEHDKGKEEEDLGDDGEVPAGMTRAQILPVRPTAS